MVHLLLDMNRLMNELPNKTDLTSELMVLDKTTVSREEHQELLLAYQNVQQERDMLRKVLRAFRMAGVRRRLLDNTADWTD